MSEKESTSIISSSLNKRKEKPTPTMYSTIFTPTKIKVDSFFLFRLNILLINLRFTFTSLNQLIKTLLNYKQINEDHCESIGSFSKELHV